MANPLLETFDTPYQLPPFSAIDTSHYIEGIDQALAVAKQEIQQIIDEKAEPSFQNTIESLENSGRMLARNSSILFNLNSAETSDELQKIAQEVSPKLSAFNSEVKQNDALFNRVKTVYDKRFALNLSSEQDKLLTETYLDFVRRGAELSSEKKERFKAISIELSKLSLSYQENVLAETNAYELVIEDEKDLSGLPEDVKSRAKELAIKKDRPDCWIFTLQAPSYIPFMEYADNRDLRETMYRAYMSKCLKGDDHDNRDIVLKTVQLKAEMAELLGYETFAAYILKQRMAQSATSVFDFLNELLEKSLPKAKEEVEELKAFIRERGEDHELQRWDWAYYSEKLRKAKYAFDEELVKPYFKLEYVIDGVFQTAEKLFGISFRPIETDTYHQEVKSYEVLDESGEVTAIFMVDFFPRDGKRGGAWMTSYRSQRYDGNHRVIPHVSIVCNFTPSTGTSPSLLKFDEVTTLFHEFGHALHGMLADTHYSSLSGTSVFWDFVELPSQIMENWCFEKECLDLFARHYETGEHIPEEMIEKIRLSSTYHEAYATVRQLSFGLLDMKWHSLTHEQAMKLSDVMNFEQEAFAPTKLFPAIDNANMSVQFSHIFAGGYAAGYYSYKWAEVLDADAFALFQENGVFDKATAQSFKTHILSKGGTQHPMELYKRFRGQEPSIDPLLKRAGLA